MSGELERVLYLEDDPSIAEVASIAMEDYANFDIRHCVSGAQAIEIAPDFAPQLLLFDVMLPEMDGVETLERVRQIAGLEDVPVIFMTAKAQTHEQARYMELGALGVIVKPFDAFTLGDQVESIWKARA